MGVGQGMGANVGWEEDEDAVEGPIVETGMRAFAVALGNGVCPLLESLDFNGSELRQEGMLLLARRLSLAPAPAFTPWTCAMRA